MRMEVAKDYLQWECLVLAMFILWVILPQLTPFQNLRCVNCKYEFTGGN
jgi:hypothetical protein